VIGVRGRADTPGREPDSGTSVIELVMYMPVLVLMILITLQLTFLYLGNQAAGAAAREAARVARSAGNPDAGSPAALDAGRIRGQQYATSVGHGLITNVQVGMAAVQGPEGPEVEATVKARGVQLIPGIPGINISKTVRGPVEVFHPDNGAA
jgi:Flp pilus assembly protein TadG